VKRQIVAAVDYLHAVTSKYFLAALAQLRPVLLQALLNCPIVAQLLSAKALCIAAASLLLLRRAHVTLCERQRSPGQENNYKGQNESHGELLGSQDGNVFLCPGFRRPWAISASPRYAAIVRQLTLFESEPGSNRSHAAAERLSAEAPALARRISAVRRKGSN
jgi:hypothetical protein